MNKQVKKLWVEALKSGNYKQGISVLNGPKGFCCLGVLCDIYIKEHKKEDPDLDWAQPSNRNYKSFKGQSLQPHRDVLEWAALEVTTELEDPQWNYSEITILNDRHRRPFTEIAKMIEAQL